MKNPLQKILITFLFVFSLSLPSGGYSQTTEERFQDLFITAGYSTAFGAALGAAFLAFSDDPASQMQYIAMGASLGFIGGSILGTYVIFAPMLSYNDVSTHQESLAYNTREQSQSRLPSPENSIYKRREENHKPLLFVQPVYNPLSAKVIALSGGLSLAL